MLNRLLKFLANNIPILNSMEFELPPTLKDNCCYLINLCVDVNYFINLVTIPVLILVNRFIGSSSQVFHNPC